MTRPNRVTAEFDGQNNRTATSYDGDKPQDRHLFDVWLDQGRQHHYPLRLVGDGHVNRPRLCQW